MMEIDDGGLHALPQDGDLSTQEHVGDASLARALQELAQALLHVDAAVCPTRVPHLLVTRLNCAEMAYACYVCVHLLGSSFDLSKDRKLRVISVEGSFDLVAQKERKLVEWLSLLWYHPPDRSGPWPSNADLFGKRGCIGATSAATAAAFAATSAYFRRPNGHVCVKTTQGYVDLDAFAPVPPSGVRDLQTLSKDAACKCLSPAMDWALELYKAWTTSDHFIQRGMELRHWALRATKAQQVLHSMESREATLAVALALDASVRSDVRRLLEAETRRRPIGICARALYISNTEATCGAILRQQSSHRNSNGSGSNFSAARRAATGPLMALAEAVAKAPCTSSAARGGAAPYLFRLEDQLRLRTIDSLQLDPAQAGAWVCSNGHHGWSLPLEQKQVCPFAKRVHSTNKMFLWYNPETHIIKLKCFSPKCRGQEAQWKVAAPLEDTYGEQARKNPSDGS